jgi:uncharacterized protein YjgD (DUF1641 family)
MSTEAIPVEEQLAEIRLRLDEIAEFVREERLRRRNNQELKNDLTLIGNDMFQATVVELEDIAGHFDSRDLLHLLKKLLRNTRNLNKMLDQLEGASGLFEELKPLGKQMFNELLESLNELDRRGYFAFGREMLAMVDTVVTSFSVEDVRRLRENIVPIIQTIRSFTQPEVLTALNRAMEFYNKMDVTVEKDVTFRALARQLRDPEVRRGIAFLLQFSKSMANATPLHPPAGGEQIDKQLTNGKRG